MLIFKCENWIGENALFSRIEFIIWLSMDQERSILQESKDKLF